MEALTWSDSLLPSGTRGLCSQLEIIFCMQIDHLMVENPKASYQHQLSYTNVSSCSEIFRSNRLLHTYDLTGKGTGVKAYWNWLFVRLRREGKKIMRQYWKMFSFILLNSNPWSYMTYNTAGGYWYFYVPGHLVWCKARVQNMQRVCGVLEPEGTSDCCRLKGSLACSGCRASRSQPWKLLIQHAALAAT